MSPERYYELEFHELVEEVRSKALTTETDDVEKEVEKRLELLKEVWEFKKPDHKTGQEKLPEFENWIPETREAVQAIFGINDWDGRYIARDTLKRQREQLEMTLDDAKTAQKIHDEEEKKHQKRAEQDPRGKKIRKRKKEEAETSSLPPAGPSSSNATPMPYTGNGSAKREKRNHQQSPQLERQSSDVRPEVLEIAKKLQPVMPSLHEHYPPSIHRCPQALTKLQKMKEKEERMEELFGKSDEEEKDVKMGEPHQDKDEQEMDIPERRLSETVLSSVEMLPVLWHRIQKSPQTGTLTANAIIASTIWAAKQQRLFEH